MGGGQDWISLGQKSQSQESVTILEGNSREISWTLSSQPSADVTVTITGHENTDLSVSPNQLTFTDQNWNIAQEVTLTANQDSDAIPDPVIPLSFTNSGGDTRSKGLTVTILDDEIPWEFAPRTVREGSNASFIVELLPHLAPPSGDVTFTISGHQGTNVVPNSPELTFPVRKWQRPQILTITTQLDLDNLDEEVTLTFTASGGGYDGLKYIAEITIYDRPPYEEYVPEGESILSKTYFIYVRSPDNSFIDITVTWSGFEGTDLTLGQAVHMVTSNQWSRCTTLDGPGYCTPTVQTEIIAAHDPDDVDDQVDLTIAVTDAPPGHPTLGTKGRIAVTIGDDDDPGLIVDPSALTIKEGDPVGGTFEVQLSEAPLGDFGNNDVTVSIPLGVGILTADKSSLTFTANNWNVSQEVTLIAGHDDNFVNDSEEIFLEASGGGYDLERGRVSVTIIDDDEPRLEITPTTITLEEGGPRKILDVRLAAQTSGEVTVTISEFGDEALSHGPDNPFKFPPFESRSLPVWVKAAEDSDTDNETEILTLTASGGGYDGVTGQITVKVNDNDLAGASLVLAPAVSVEEGSSSDFTVSLSTPPTGTVTVTIPAFKNPDLSWSSEPLIFNASNHNSPQSVTVKAAEDSDTDDETEILTLTASGGGYDGVTGQVTVKVNDNDLAGASLVLDPVEVSVEEGSSSDFTVSLSTPPTGTVTVTIPAFKNPDLSWSSEPLIFNASNYNSPQSVTVTAAKDLNAENEEETLILTASGGGYNGVEGEVTVKVNDNDQASLVLDPVEISVEEGSSSDFTVSLSTPPTGTVTVTIPVFKNPDLTRFPETLTFTRSNYGDPQSVTVRAPRDDNTSNETEILTLTANGGGYDGVKGDIEVTVLDAGAVSVTLLATPVEVNEGDEVTLTAELSRALQTTEVMIPLIYEGTGEAPATEGVDYIGPASITIPAGQRSGSVRIEIRDDEIAEHAERFTVAIGRVLRQGLLRGTPSSEEVTILDYDEAGIVLSPRSLTVVEGADAADYTVSLSSEPRSPVTLALLTEGSERITWTPPVLTFTADDWDSPQGVTVMAPPDDDAIEEDVVLTHRASSLDAIYDGRREDLPVTVLDIEETDLKGIQLDPAFLEITEGGPSGTYTVVLTSAPTSEVEVTLRGDEGKATLTPMSLRFHSSNWEVPQKVTVEAVQDRDLDDETLTVLHTASGGGYDGERAELALRITDQMPVTISIYDAQAQERAGRVDLRVELNRSTEVPITVSYETVAGTATSGEDYVRSRGLVIFDPGSRAGQIQIELIPDEIAEQEEQFTVRIANARPVGQVSIARPEGQVTIFDAARALAVRIDDAVMRGERVQFAVQLSAPSETNVRVHYRTEDQTARAGEDYHAIMGVLTFAPGEWEQTIEVDLVPGRVPWQGKTFGMRLEHTTEGTIEKAMAVATIQEESPSPEVMRAHAVRFVRTSTIQVVEGLRSRPTSSSCRAAERMGLVQLWGARSRWRPSLGELLAGCRVVQEQGVDRGWLSVWGQGAFTRFHGRGEGVLNLRGEVTTAMLGTDYRWPSGWRTGLLVTHSLGEGSYRRLAESGQVQSSLTQVVPYVSVQWVDWEAWLALGYGRGQTEVAPLEGRLVSVFGAAGVEGTWRSTRRAGWTLHGDVLVAEAEVDQYEVRGEVIRVRVGVQGVLRVHEKIRPYVEANVRQDGGHAETGTGLELGGGVRFASGQVKAELRTQGLVMHTAEGFTEWGASGVVQVGGGSTGWGMTIRPSWGPTYGDRLHRQQTILDVTSSAANLYRTEVEFAYGTPMKSGVARSVVGVTQMPHGRMYRVGTQLRPWDRMRVSVFGLAHSRRNLGLNVRGALSY